MSIFYPTPASYFALLDYGSDDPIIFDSLTGGDRKISLVNYNVMAPVGSVTTKFMPGQTSFEPVTLLRSMDKYDDFLNQLFVDAVNGVYKKIRRHFSIYMYDGEGNPLVWWDLFDAVPASITGFSFNSKTESSYTDFELTLQAESIEVVFADTDAWSEKGLKIKTE